MESSNDETVTNHDHLKENSSNSKSNAIQNSSNSCEWVVWFFLGPAFQGARKLVLLQGVFGAMILFGIFTSLHFIPGPKPQLFSS